MTKKGSIFKTLGEYFKSHLGAGLGWIWVTVMPGLGSLFLLSNTQNLENLALEQPLDHVLFTVVLAVALGLALLPTTLSALATGFYFGWIGFPGLFVGYLLANVIGYQLGKMLNADLLSLLYLRKPELRSQLENRIQHPKSLIFFVRISPVIPFAISNFLFASLKIDLKKVLLFGVPGMLPRTLIAFATGLLASSLLDAKKAMNDPRQWVILAFLLLLSFWGLYRNWKKSKA
jgi:uncharacterized membrane protein YdjX (TVP38/TMEM64 family)